MNFPGSAPMGHMLGNKGGQQPMNPDEAQAQYMMKMMTAAMESCPSKTVISGVMGFGLGGVFGLFMSSMRYDTPLGSAAGTLQSLPMRQQLAAGFKDMGKASWSSAKNFGMVGALFSGTECCIEGLRGKNELSNGVAAGCITGGILARNGGPQAAAVGCAGFAAFSAAIDAYMRQPSEPAFGPRID